MADIKILYVNSDSVYNEHSETTDSIRMFSFKTANKELTDAKLTNLIDGVDANNEHIHDGRYYRENEHISVSTGVSDASKPVITDLGGKLDSSLIDTSELAPLLDHNLLDNLAVGDVHTQYILVNGTRAFTGDQSLGGFKITNLANPVAGTDAVNLQTLQSYQEGLKPKTAVRVATIANINLASAPSAIDGVTLANGDRVLVKDQTSASENGIYVFNGAASAMTRALDFDSLTPIDEINGAYTFVQEGTTHAGKGYVQTGAVTTLNTDLINFVFFNAAASITASTGLVKVGNDIQIAPSAAGSGLGFTAGVLNVNVDDASLEINTDILRVKADGINDTHIDFGTGASQVNAEDLPVIDTANYFTTKNVEAALSQLAESILANGVEYTVGAGGVNKGDLVFISGANTVLPLTTLNSSNYCVGLALETKAATEIVKVLANDTILTGVLTGASPGTKYFWNGTTLVTTAPTGTGSHVWQVGVAKNTTDLHVEVKLIKRNA